MAAAETLGDEELKGCEHTTRHNRVVAAWVRAVQAAAGICSHDNNGDGTTDIEDLLNLIEGWGQGCNPW